jgi:predicted transcriptional regulator
MTLREYLADQGLTEGAFAEMLGISQAAVNRYVNGDRTPKQPIMRAIMRATKGEVTANDFMGAD